MGTVPLSIESWKILVRIGAISAECSFRNHSGMASGPEALFVFNSDNCFATPLHGDRQTVNGWYSVVSNIRDV